MKQIHLIVATLFISTATASYAGGVTTTVAAAEPQASTQEAKKCRCQVFRVNHEGLETVCGAVG